MQQVTGKLYDHQIIEHEHEGQRYRLCWGHIYGDIHKRFDDGTWIRTSYIVEGPDENNIITTRNSVYQLVVDENS